MEPHLAKQLEKTEAHADEGERLIAHQREVIARMTRNGHDTEIAVALLRNFEQAQAVTLADRDQLRAELARAG